MRKKHPYFKLIAFSLLLTFTVTLFSALAVITKTDENGTLLFQITAFLLMGLFFTIYIKKHDPTLQSFGFHSKKTSPYFFLLLGIIILVQPIILGIDSNLSLQTFLLIIIQMLLVGYTEEILFRSIFFYQLKEKKAWVYILFSALVFGILHSMNAVNPASSLLLVALQIVNALLLGIVFATIYWLTRNISLLILAHALFNIFATITKTTSIERIVYSVIILSIIYLVVLLLLYRFKNYFRQIES